MSKAEDRALEVYPKDIEEFIDINDVKSVVDNNNWQRTIFIKGYRQAEKDLELSWEDVKEICDIAFEEACRLQRNMKGSRIYKEQHYREVLKRFKEKKMNTDKLL